MGKMLDFQLYKGVIELEQQEKELEKARQLQAEEDKRRRREAILQLDTKQLGILLGAVGKEQRIAIVDIICKLLDVDPENILQSTKRKKIT